MASTNPSKFKERVLFIKLQSLSGQELKRFWDYLSISTKNKRIIKLSQYLKKHFQSISFDENKMAAFIFGADKNNEMALARLLNLANNTLNKFIINEISGKSEWENHMDSDLALMDFYQERMLFKYALKLAKKIEKNLAERTIQDEVYFKYRMLYYLRPRMVDHQDPEALAKQQAQKTQVIDEFYFFNKLYSEAWAKSHQNSFKTEGNSLFIKNIVEHLKNNAYTGKSSIVLLSRTVDLLANATDDRLFNELETELFKHHKNQSKDLNSDLFTILQNTYLKRETDRLKIAQKVLEYSLFQIENDIIFANGFFPSLSFENIISTGLKAKGSEWVRAFINQYGHRIHPDSRKGSINFARAKCHFFDGNANECLVELAKINRSRFKNVYLNIIVRILKIKAFYEVDPKASEFDRNQPDRDINAFRKYIGGKSVEISDYYLQRFKNFANTVSRLMVCNNKKRAIGLLDEISNPSFIVEDKLWLTEKARELT